MIVKIIKKLPKFKDIKDRLTKEQYKLFAIDSVHDIEDKELAVFLIDLGYAEITEEKPEEEEEEKDVRAKGYYALEPFTTLNHKLMPGEKMTEAQIEAADLKSLLSKGLIEKVK